MKQVEGIFPLTEDSLFLGRFATIHHKDRICDLGTGSGVLLLLLAQRAVDLEIYGIDKDPDAVRLTERNLQENGLNGEIVCCSAGTVRQHFVRQSCDLVISNPPYYREGAGDDGGIARMERGEGLDAFCEAAAFFLRPGGRFAFCYRTDRLTEALVQLREKHLEPKRIKIQKKVIWIEAVKDAKENGLRVEE